MLSFGGYPHCFDFVSLSVLMDEKLTRIINYMNTKF